VRGERRCGRGARTGQPRLHAASGGAGEERDGGAEGAGEGDGPAGRRQLAALGHPLRLQHDEVLAGGDVDDCGDEGGEPEAAKQHGAGAQRAHEHCGGEGRGGEGESAPYFCASGLASALGTSARAGGWRMPAQHEAAVLQPAGRARTSGADADGDVGETRLLRLLRRLASVSVSRRAGGSHSAGCPSLRVRHPPNRLRAPRQRAQDAALRLFPAGARSQDGCCCRRCRERPVRRPSR